MGSYLYETVKTCTHTAQLKWKTKQEKENKNNTIIRRGWNSNQLNKEQNALLPPSLYCHAICRWVCRGEMTKLFYMRLGVNTGDKLTRFILTCCYVIWLLKTTSETDHLAAACVFLTSISALFKWSFSFSGNQVNNVGILTPHLCEVWQMHDICQCLHLSLNITLCNCLDGK